MAMAEKTVKKYSLLMHSPSSEKRKWWIRAFQILLLVSIFAGLWQLASGEQAAKLLLEADAGLLGLVFFLLSMQTVISAFRWKITASQLGIQMGYRRALSEYYIAQAANQSLPGGVLGDFARVARSSQPAGWLSATQAVVIERLAGQLGLLLVFLASLALVIILPVGVLLPSWLLVSIGLFLAGLVILGLVFANPGKRNDSGFGRFLVTAWSKLRLTLFAKKVFSLQAIFSLSTAILNVSAFVLAAWAIGAEIDLLASFVVIPIVLLAMLMPLTIGGWGVREALAAALFPIISSNPTEGLAASVAFGLVLLLASMPGVVAVFVVKRSRVGKSGVTS